MSDLKKIAKNYLKGSCIFDLLANIPFELMFTVSTQTSLKYSKYHTAAPGVRQNKTRLFRLFKLFRVPRLFALLNVNRVKQIIGGHYNRILYNAVKNNDETTRYNILRSLMLVQLYKIFRLVVIIFTSSYFLGIFWHIFVQDVQVTEYVEEDDYYSGPKIPNFLTEKLGTDNPESTDTPPQVLVKVFYFAITTLSTIGFGDFHPVSV